MALNKARLEQAVTLSQQDFDDFAEISGDHNPIHVDPQYASVTRFGATVSHGMLLFSHLRALIARSWPGATLSMQELMFPAPAYADEALTVIVEARQPDDLFTTRVVKADGSVCLEGRARIHIAEENTP
ncbi:MaoC/PaaZ C-terminal domain-containing protein [Alloalcanivorax xenomutans]|uniref:MaoC/PaaZ C-terminal domain-containing protein n=1 Tax=Alloalcanivorax xenomutans TaxID=1094342 RepID=UPI003A80AEFA